MVDPKSMSDQEATKQAGIDHILMHGSAFHALANDTGKKILVEGKGIMVKDIDGDKYIDALAGPKIVCFVAGSRCTASNAALLATKRFQATEASARATISITRR
tara:strand:+ start:354 stop:665 length:312 start_codon:yes stop_codon:yes gene_type:complete